jgi:protein-glutamine gamma-glutamyltransferase
MTFARYFKASSYCLIASGFIAIAATGKIGMLFPSVFALILAASWFLDTEKIRRHAPGWALNSIVLAYLPVFILDYLFWSHSLMFALIHLILFAAAIKLLTLAQDSDYFILYLISFAELIAASTITMNLIFGVCFLLFLISGVSALILFEMRRSNAHLRNQAVVQPLVVPQNLKGTPWELFSPFPAWLLFAMTLGIALLIMTIAVPVFFLLPRVTSGLQNRPPGKTELVTGFSDRVELGKSGSIGQSNAIVMRIKISDSGSGYPTDLKWRGLAFDYYDGRSWSRTDSHRIQTPGQGQFYKLETSAKGANLLFQTFFVEALSTDVVFAANKALAISRDVGKLQQDSNQCLFAARPPFTKLRYSAISDLSRVNPDEFQNTGDVPPDNLSIYLQKPISDPRITELAGQATEGAASGYSRALQMERYLRSHYRYSLELPKIPKSKDPLSAFLFETKKGHCEYFASAMAIMLRSIGIPSRLINGFQSGEYNQIGGHWIVRQYNAHSWVEAYFPSSGWVTFDPTPPEMTPSKPAIARFLSDLTDAIDLWWWDGVLDYDLLKQYRVLGGMRSAIEQFQLKSTGILGSVWDAIRGKANLKQMHYTPVKRIPWVLLTAVVLIALLAGKHRRKIRHWLQRTLHSNNPSLAAHGFYMNALLLLYEKGMKRSRGQTLMEFALSLKGHPAAEPFLTLTRMYNAARFGPPGIPLNASKAAEQLRLLRLSLKKQKGHGRHGLHGFFNQ